MLKTICAGTICLMTLAIACQASEAKPKKADAKSATASPLKDLPSAPGPHMAQIAALGDDAWLQLGAPKADPKWGKATGRSWGGRALIYAPDIDGAFFYGEGPHAGTKPDGQHGLDDLWLYDVNGHRWIALYPGTDFKNFNQQMKAKELQVNANGTLADKDGQPLPIHALIHAWDLLSYDTDLRQFAFVGNPSVGRYFLAGGAQMEEGLQMYEATRGAKASAPMSPWTYDVATGKFGIYPIPAPVEVGGYPYFQYVKSRKQYLLAGSTGVAWYDPAKHAWAMEADNGPRPEGYDHGGCYDEKHERIFMGDGNASGTIRVYDIAGKTWTKPSTKGPVPAGGFRTDDGSVFYDTANDVVTIFQYKTGKCYTYAPESSTWTERPLPDAVTKSIGYPSFNAFYHPKLNAYFVHVATDGADNGSMWVYRYKAAPTAKKAKPAK